MEYYIFAAVILIMLCAFCVMAGILIGVETAKRNFKKSVDAYLIITDDAQSPFILGLEKSPDEIKKKKRLNVMTVESSVAQFKKGL